MLSIGSPCAIRAVMSCLIVHLRTRGDLDVLLGLVGALVHEGIVGARHVRLEQVENPESDSDIRADDVLGGLVEVLV